MRLEDARAYRCAATLAGVEKFRHAVPGEGTIRDGLLSVVHHPAFADLPMILELALDDARRGIGYLLHGMSDA
jgi:endonuclease IV